MSGPGVAGDRDAAMMDAARPRPPFGPSRRHRSVRHSRRSTPERIVKRFFSSFQPTQRCLVHSNEIFVTLLDDSVNRFDLLSFSSLLASRTKWFVHTFVMQIDKRIGKFDPLWKLERRDTWSIFAYQRIGWIYYQTKVVMVWCCGMNLSPVVSVWMNGSCRVEEMADEGGASIDSRPCQRVSSQLIRGLLIGEPVASSFEDHSNWPTSALPLSAPKMYRFPPGPAHPSAASRRISPEWPD